VTVEQMASIVHPRDSAQKVMAVIEAYFDESGFSEDAFALCGYVAPKDEWKNGFERQWSKLLAKPCKHQVQSRQAEAICSPLDYLHATEMEGMGKGKFRSLGSRNRRYLIDSSIGIVKRSGIVGIGSAVLKASYEKLDDPSREIVGNAYLMCFQFILSEVARTSEMFLGPTSENIAYIFERSPMWAPVLLEMWNRIYDTPGLRKKHRMGTLTFADKREFMPLQAADRLAFETKKHFTNPVERPEWRALTDWPQHHGRYFNDEGMEDLVKNLKASGKLPR
jgi:hypothetical protein